MPSKDSDRIYVTFGLRNQDLLKMIRREAELDGVSESSIVVQAVKRYYRMRKETFKEEAELFTPTRLHEAKRMEAPIFEMPPPLPAERVRKLRATLDQEKS